MEIPGKVMATHDVVSVKPAAKSAGGRCLRAAGVALSGAVVVSSLAIVLPRAVGAQWSSISAVALHLSAIDIGLLFAVWLAGLVTYGVVQAAALPGLGVQRAIILNFAGSCVSNIVPFGGVAGTGVNLAMVRRWNHGTQSFVQFLAVTHILNLIAKLALPAVAIVVLLATGTMPTGSMLIAGGVTLAVLAAVLAMVGFLLGTEGGAAALGAVLQPAIGLLGRVWPALGQLDAREALQEFRASAVQLLRWSWLRFAAGMSAYSSLQFLLFVLCLRMIGSPASISVLLAAFAVERVMTLVVLTPGGVGLAETMTTVVLVALHANPVISGAGVVIYRVFTYLFEIPVGATVLAAWWVARVRSVPAAALTARRRLRD